MPKAHTASPPLKPVSSAVPHINSLNQQDRPSATSGFAQESMNHCSKIGGSVQHDYIMTPKKRSGLVGTIAPVLVSIMLASSCRTCLGEGQVKHPQPKLQLGQADETSASSTNLPRILTLLTTYNQRTQYIKAYREVAADRTDGYEPMIFVTSDETDADPDGVIDYKFGRPRAHRLVAALREATSRYSGQFDWIAIGDDDTIFMYKRAMALLRHIDHTQPIAIGMVHGFCGFRRRRRAVCECFSPEERRGESANKTAANGCCLDITQPCEVPIVPDPSMSGSSMKTFLRDVTSYGGDLYWPYGGTGFFMSAALAETIQANGDGWEVCREMFGRYHTDMQVARCLIANGYTMSGFTSGFYEPGTANVEQIRDHIASECQIVGVHAGFRHLEGGSEYTTDEFKATLSTVWAEDDAQPWLADGSLETECPQTWATVSRWM